MDLCSERRYGGSIKIKIVKSDGITLCGNKLNSCSENMLISYIQLPGSACSQCVSGCLALCST